MKIPVISLNSLNLTVLLAFQSVGLTHAEEARYFRIMGPVPTAITSFTAGGYLAWTNVQTNATFTIQSASVLLI